MSEVMLDLETMSTDSRASILTLGAIKFTRGDPIIPLEKCDSFYRRIDLKSCQRLGMVSSNDTIKWWDDQSVEARYEAFDNPDRTPLRVALVEFTQWFRGAQKIWAHGDDFDCVILANAFTVCGLTVPWKFWNTRDTRTIYDLGGVRMTDLPQNNAHHALHDCHRQIVGIQKSLDNLKL